MALLPTLSDDNPWWKSTEKINDDPQIIEWEKSSIKWDPRIRHTFDHTNDLFYSLRGPRQIGKTTLVKLQIREFLQNGISPWNIMYYAFDIDNTPTKLVEIIRNYLENTVRQRKDNRSYLFLDEVSSIKDWQKGIKRLWDQKRLSNCTVVATGSHTVDLKMSTEKLPGRRGITSEPLDKIMLPMKFAEFVSILNPDLKKEIENKQLFHASTRLKIFRNITNGIISEQIEDLQPYLNELNQYLIDYVITGGIPRVVNEYIETHKISEGTYTTYLDAIIGDLNSLNKHESVFRQLIQNVITSTGWPASWSSLQKNTDIGSKNTVAEYIDILTRMFILSVFYQYDSTNKRGLIQKEKKIHFHDPFYFHVLHGWCNNRESFELCKSYISDQTNFGLLLEGIVADHLIRLAFNFSQKKQTFVYANLLYFWKYGPDKEVDFIYNDGINHDLPIEVKFQKRIINRDLDGIINFKRQTGVKNALLLTKQNLQKDNECVMIPTSMFLLLI